MIENFQILLGDCLQSMRSLPDQSVNCCVTSPPYFGLRDYGVDGQLGLEATPEEFVEALVAVFREVRRLLRDDGTAWLNLGDSYARNPAKGQHKPGDSGKQAYLYDTGGGRASVTAQTGLADKQLIGIPWRVAFALQADGWYLRQDIIWQKPNVMPESVTDRCTKAHEYIFLLTKSPKYAFDNAAIKEPAVGSYAGRAATFDRSGNPVSEHILPGQSAAQHRARPSVKRGGFNGKTEAMADTGQNAFRAVVGMRNKRSVWTVATRSFKGAHFATFPPELIEPCILAGCPNGGTVLDPFGGSGTTAGVALAHGRNAIVCELNPEYAELMPERIGQIMQMYEKIRPCKDDKQIPLNLRQDPSSISGMAGE